MKMPVLGHVGTEAGGATLDRDLAGQARFYERIQAVIYRGVGYFRHGLLGADKNLLGRGMITLLQKHVIDLLPLGRQAQTGGSQLPGQVLLLFKLAGRLHPKSI
jgi:hypothetical protein